jgi:hypothetical protein
LPLELANTFRLGVARRRLLCGVGRQGRLQLAQQIGSNPEFHRDLGSALLTGHH